MLLNFHFIHIQRSFIFSHIHICFQEVYSSFLVCLAAKENIFTYQLFAYRTIKSSASKTAHASLLPNLNIKTWHTRNRTCKNQILSKLLYYFTSIFVTHFNSMHRNNICIYSARYENLRTIPNSSTTTTAQLPPKQSLSSSWTSLASLLNSRRINDNNTTIREHILGKFCKTALMRSQRAKLSLCLTKYLAMKTYPVLHSAPRHEDVWGNGSITPRICNLGNRWKWVGSFTLRLQLGLNYEKMYIMVMVNPYATKFIKLVRTE
jgi:hypothetical protein